MQKNKDTAVFAHNADKTLGERVRDLNQFYEDASMSNMVAHRKFEIGPDGRAEYINVRNMDDNG